VSFYTSFLLDLSAIDFKKIRHTNELLIDVSSYTFALPMSNRE